MSRHWSERQWRMRQLSNRAAVSGDERQPARIAGLSQPSGQPQAAHRHGRSGPHQRTVAPEPGQLWPPQDDRRTEGSRCRCGAPACRARSTGKRSPGSFSEPVSLRENGIVVERTRKFKATTDSDHTFNIAPNLLDRDFAAAGPNQNRRSAQRNGRVISATSGPARYEPGQKTIRGIVFPAIGLYLAVILDLHSRPSPLDLNQWRTMARHRLGRQQPHEAGSGDPGAEDGHRPAIPAARLHLPQRPRQPILLPRLPTHPA